jgi:hyperosmotically inducible periplasmic protein
MKSISLSLFAVFALLLGVACSSRTNTVSYKDNVKKALEQVDLKDVTVQEDREKNAITLSGKVHSENAKLQAAEVAQAAAGNRIIANEISVEPVGGESQSRTIASNQDAAIEKEYKAALVAKGLDREHIRFKAKNGVLTLEGSVKNPRERQEAQQIAANVSNVQQVLNEIEVSR